MYGLGRRRHRLGLGRRRHRGRGVMDFLKKAQGFVKNNQLISRGAAMLAPHIANRFGDTAGNIASGIGSAAGALGYGRRRRRLMHHRGGMRHHLYGHGLRLAGM